VGGLYHLADALTSLVRVHLGAFSFYQDLSCLASLLKSVTVSLKAARQNNLDLELTQMVTAASLETETHHCGNSACTPLMKTFQQKHSQTD